MGKNHCILSKFRIGGMSWDGAALKKTGAAGASAEMNVKVLKSSLVYEWSMCEITGGRNNSVALNSTQLNSMKLNETRNSTQFNSIKRNST